MPPVIVDLFPKDDPRYLSTDKIALATASGTRIFRLRGVGAAWTVNGTHDFTALDDRLHQQLLVPSKRSAEIHSDVHSEGHSEINSEINLKLPSESELYFILEVSVDPPDRWLAAHPDETARFCLNAPAPTETGEGKRPAADRHWASWASKRWLNDAGDALARLVRHVQQSPWATRCLGYQISCGSGGDWVHPYAERLPDIGPRMTERFRGFVVDKYRRNQGLLRQGWDDPRADFDRVRCPDAFERRYADIGMLRDPLKSRKMLDYYECFFGAQNEAALHFCGVVKRVTERRALVGLAYASPFGRAQPPLAEASHGLPEPVFDSPDVDFFVADPAAPGLTATSTFNGSLQLREKFLFLTANEGHYTPLELARAQAHLAGLITRFPREASWLQFTNEMAARNLQAPSAVRKRSTQIAVIVDALQPTYLAGSDENRKTWVEATFNAQIAQLAQTGAPFDVFLLSDLFHPKFSDHKVYIFLNTLYLSEAERRRIDARVKRTAQTTLWLWGAGILSEKGVDEAAAQHLLDMKVRIEKNETSLRVRVVEGNDPLTWGMHVSSMFGPERTAVPTLTIGDKTAIRLGANSDNKTVFAARRNADWTGIQYGTLPVPTQLLRNALRAAGVHLYAGTTDTNLLVVAGTGLLGIIRQGTGEGNVTISLPAAHDVNDPRTGKRITTGSDITLPRPDVGGRVLEIRPLAKKVTPAPGSGQTAGAPATKRRS